MTSEFIENNTSWESSLELVPAKEKKLFKALPGLIRSVFIKIGIDLDLDLFYLQKIEHNNPRRFNFKIFYRDNFKDFTFDSYIKKDILFYNDINLTITFNQKDKFQENIEKVIKNLYREQEDFNIFNKLTICIDRKLYIKNFNLKHTYSYYNYQINNGNTNFSLYYFFDSLFELVAYRKHINYQNLMDNKERNINYYYEKDDISIGELVFLLQGQVMALNSQYIDELIPEFLHDGVYIYANDSVEKRMNLIEMMSI